jgi:hypothetical protein
LAQKPRHLRFIFDQEANDAAQAAHLRLNLREPRAQPALDGIEPQIDLPNIAANGGRSRFKPVYKASLKMGKVASGSHLLAHLCHLVANSLKLAAGVFDLLAERLKLASPNQVFAHCVN